jgi:predicted ribosomally synthesized peptide with nif11-like leader
MTCNCGSVGDLSAGRLGVALGGLTVSTDHISNFQAQIKKDPKLQEKLQGLKGETDRKVLTQKIADIAKTHGHSVTAGEVDSYLKTAVKGRELSDDALKGVAGGAKTSLKSGSWTYSYPGC